MTPKPAPIANRPLVTRRTTPPPPSPVADVARKVVSPVASVAQADPIGGAALLAAALLVVAAAGGGLVVLVATNRLARST